MNQSQKSRNQRKSVIGTVTSAKMDKTRRVEISRNAKHPIYGKYLRRRTVCYVHDGDNVSQVGDRVEIMETRPISKNKRWRLVKVVRSASGSDAEAGGQKPEPVSAGEQDG